MTDPVPVQPGHSDETDLRHQRLEQLLHMGDTLVRHVVGRIGSVQGEDGAQSDAVGRGIARSEIEPCGKRGPPYRPLDLLIVRPLGQTDLLPLVRRPIPAPSAFPPTNLSRSGHDADSSSRRANQEKTAYRISAISARYHAIAYRK